MVYYYTAPLLMLMRTFSDLLLASLMSTFWPSTFMPGPGQRRPRANVVKLEKTRNVANIDKLQQRDRKKQEIVNAQNQKTNAQKPLT
jgi:hypothetical protein